MHERNGGKKSERGRLWVLPSRLLVSPHFHFKRFSLILHILLRHLVRIGLNENYLITHLYLSRQGKNVTFDRKILKERKEKKEIC